MQRSRAGYVSVVAKAKAKAFPVIMVTGNHKDGLRDQRNHFRRQGVFSLGPLIHDVAGQENQIRLQLKCCKMPDRRQEHFIGVDDVVVKISWGAQMRVG